MKEGEQRLTITPSRMGEDLLLRLHGRLTATTAPIFEAALISALGRAGKGLIVDLRDLSDIDARGIGELVRAHLLGQHRNRPIRFLIRNGPVVQLIRMAGLENVLTVVTETNEAIPTASR